MADDARDYTSLSVYARQIEDPHDPSRPNPHDVLEPVTGVFEIGVVIDGARVPIFVEKASKVVALIERNRVASPVEPRPGETSPPELEPTQREIELEERVAALERERDDRERAGTPPPISPPPNESAPPGPSDANVPPESPPPPPSE